MNFIDISTIIENNGSDAIKNLIILIFRLSLFVNGKNWICHH